MVHFATLWLAHECAAHLGVGPAVPVGVTCLLCHFVPCGGLGLGAFKMGSSGSW